MIKKSKDKSPVKESMNSIDDLQNRLLKDHGKEILVSNEVDKNIQWMSTGLLSLDYIFGNGIPRGRIVEIFGQESSGKTTLCLNSISKAQKRGGKCALIDAEYAFEPKFAKILGVDENELMLISPDNGEQALDACYTMVQSNLLDLIVVDSVAALVPKEEADNTMGTQQMGLQARMMSKALRKLTAIIGKTKTTVFFINQLRKKIGVMWGNPETTTGGDALKFYSSLRIDVRKVGFLGEKQDGKVISPEGIIQKVKAIKNKCAPPFRETELKIRYKTGYDIVDDIFNSAVNFGVIQKDGAWYSYKSEKLGQGEEKASAYLKSQKDILKVIAKEVRTIFSGMD